MHHDIAAPMLLHPNAPNQTVYANLIRTNYHRYKIFLPLPRWLLNTLVEKCAYYSAVSRTYRWNNARI
jgi:hypothetical protein